MMTKTQRLIGLLGLAMLLSVAQAEKAPPRKAPPAFPVGIITVTPKTLALTQNLPGRLVAHRDAVIRARVTGIVKKRFFRQGSYVSAGQPLFQIDDRNFRASLATAKAKLAQSIATKKLHEANVKRYQHLLKSNAISRQVYEQAKTQLASANANIQMAKAAITQIRLNIEYAKVSAPIDGYIGQSDVSEGTLVSAATSTKMAEIQQINPLYIDIKQPANQVLKMKRLLIKKGISFSQLQNMGIKVKTYFEDGTPYNHAGKLMFVNANSNAETGEVSMRATLPNPEYLLMPGLYVRVEIPQSTITNAVLIPQQAVTRGEVDTVFVVNKDNTYSPRVIKIAQSQGHQWLVTSGLKSGDKVIVDGMQKVLMMRLKKVTPVPWKTAQPKKQPTQKTK